MQNNMQNLNKSNKFSYYFVLFVAFFIALSFVNNNYLTVEKNTHEFKACILETEDLNKLITPNDSQECKKLMTADSFEEWKTLIKTPNDLKKLITQNNLDAWKER